MKIVALSGMVALLIVSAGRVDAGWKRVDFADPMGKDSEVRISTTDKLSPIQTVSYGFRCHLRSKKWGVYVDFDTYLGVTNDSRVNRMLMRFDEGEPFRVSTVVSADGTTLLDWTRRTVKKQIDLSLGAKVLAIRASDYRGVEYTAVFNISGFRSAVSQNGIPCILP